LHLDLGQCRGRALQARARIRRSASAPERGSRRRASGAREGRGCVDAAPPRRDDACR
jgi:hypothetical protein